MVGGYNLPRDSCRKKLCEASQEKRIGMCCAAVIPGVQLTGTDLSPPTPAIVPHKESLIMMYYVDHFH